VALQLKRAGIRRVRPLAGGFAAWRKLNFPVEPVNLEAAENPNMEVKANVNGGS